MAHLKFESQISPSSLRILKKLSSPKKIQDFLDTLPVNLEETSDTYMSVERTLASGEAHCLEGALVAALSLWIQGQPPLLLDLKSSNGDDHIVALFKQGGRWGAISKTNHTTLRFRDPVYETVRELALSYFHEYIHLKTGEKILVSYSEPFDLRKVKAVYEPGEDRNSDMSLKHKTVLTNKESIIDWISGKGELDWLADSLDESVHHKIYPSRNKKYLRKADKVELSAGNIVEWNKKDKK
ncbi:MAG: hypothetical protein K9M11_00700 [Candidatus Pacebacteria bacterium]|nr:hypothetical protein [Candidatus Paceibacterota bacterium]